MVRSHADKILGPLPGTLIEQQMEKELINDDSDLLCIYCCLGLGGCLLVCRKVDLQLSNLHKSDLYELICNRSCVHSAYSQMEL